MNVSASVEEAFRDFIVSRKTKGVTDKTIESYQHQFKAVIKHFDVTKDIYTLHKKDLDNMISSMRNSSLAPAV